jgi:replicative DNA helicase
VCDEISNTAYSEGESVSDLIDIAENKILSIARGTERSGFVHIKDIIIREFESFTKAAENPDEIIGIPSGFSDLDRLIVGMSPGDLVLIGARPGMGKTSFAMNIAVNFAKRSRKKVCVFSLEMPGQQLALRLLASEARIDSTKMRCGTLSDDEWARLADASTNLSMCEIYIDDTSGIGVAGMKAKLRRMKDVGLIVVDYLQLIQSDRRSENRVQEVADISRNLKLLAKEMQIPLICCAQLSRGPESRQDKRPMLSDLRDSGAIEQDADIVMFLYRGEYYKTSGAEYEDAEIIIAKNRHGPVGNVKIGWFGKYTKFVTIADDSYEQLASGK